MKGYCQTCAKHSDMIDIQTIELGSLDYVQEGKCQMCSGVVWHFVNDDETLVTDQGQKYPRDIYPGDKTPSKLIKFKQNKIIKTLKKIKEGMRDEKNSV